MLDVLCRYFERVFKKILCVLLQVSYRSLQMCDIPPSLWGPGPSADGGGGGQHKLGLGNIQILDDPQTDTLKIKQTLETKVATTSQK